MGGKKGTEHKATAEMREEILNQLVEKRFNITEVARAMCYSRATIMYHIQQIKKKTGKDPLNLFDLAELLRIDMIVRCKDCVHFTDDAVAGFNTGTCWYHERGCKLNDYCNHGVWRSDDG